MSYKLPIFYTFITVTNENSQNDISSSIPKQLLKRMNSQEISLTIIIQATATMSNENEYYQNIDLRSKSIEQKIGNSPYIINNSLQCSLKHKRASFDIKLYLQLHRKLVRKAVIEKKFQESAFDVFGSNGQKRKGFKGKRKPDTFLCKSSSLKNRESRVYTQGSIQVHQSTNKFTKKQSNKPLNRENEVELAPSALNSHNKPNMMYNLSLYRKGFKNSSLKREKMCLSIMQNFYKSKREMTRDTSTKRTKMLTTIS